MDAGIKYPYLFVWLLWFSPAPADDKTITISTFDWCPFICPMNAEYPGLLVEYTEAIYKRAGYEVEFQPYPWSRAIRNTETGLTDALLAPAKNETPTLKFPTSAIGNQRFCFFTLKEEPWLYKEPSSVVGKRILYPQDALPEVLEEYRDKAYFEKKSFTEKYLGQSIKMLDSGRIDASLMTYYSMTYFLVEQNLSDRIKSSGCVSSQDLYLAFTPASGSQAKVKELITAFENSIHELKQEQFFEKLLIKYRLD